jgi:hypothetical protein
MTQVEEKKAERQELRRLMLVRKYIEGAMNGLVRRVRKLVDDTNISATQMEKHQISNLLGVALDTGSVEVVINFIQYQVGRDARGTNWRAKGFGNKLVRELKDLQNTARAIAGKVQSDLEQSQSPRKEEIDGIWIELVRRYLGQMNRYFYYRKEARP